MAYNPTTNATGAPGADGEDGAPGANGTNGATWHTGSGAPAGGTGVNGDFYLRTSNGDVYQKAAGSWSVIANITGPAGADGTDGADGIFSAIASQAEAEAGTENTKGMTALRTKQAIDALGGAPGGGSSLILDYHPTTALHSGTSVTNGVWTDVCPDQAFTVASGTSLVEISIGGKASMTSAIAHVVCRLIIDEGDAGEITRPLGGMFINAAGDWENALAGCASQAFDGVLTAGSHDIKVQILSHSSGLTLYCRCNDTANSNESLHITVIERT